MHRWCFNMHRNGRLYMLSLFEYKDPTREYIGNSQHRPVISPYMKMQWPEQQYSWPFNEPIDYTFLLKWDSEISNAG